MPFPLLCRRAAALCLLFGLVATVEADSPTPATAPATETPPCPRVADALSGVTLRPRGQLGLKLDGSDKPMLEKWREKVGIQLEEVDCFALVQLDDSGRQVLVV